MSELLQLHTNMSYSKSELAQIVVMAEKIEQLLGVSELKNKPENEKTFNHFKSSVVCAKHTMMNVDKFKEEGIIDAFDDLISASIELNKFAKHEPAITNAPIYQKYGLFLNIWDYTTK